MKQNIIAIVVICVSHLSAGEPSAGSRDKVIEDFSSWHEFISKHGKQVATLTSDRNDTIAINALWFRTLLRAYDPETRFERYDDASIGYFLGFVEGRIRHRPPQWWRDRMLSNFVRYEQRVYEGSFSVHGRPEELVVSLENGVMWASFDEKRIRLKAPQLLLRNIAEGGLEAAIIFAQVDEQRLYVSASRYPLSIACFDKTSGETIWQSQIWGDSGEGSSTGPPMPREVQIIVSKDRLLVFGAGPTHYFQILDVKSGKSLAWWTSKFDPFYFEYR